MCWEGNQTKASHYRLIQIKIKRNAKSLIHLGSLKLCDIDKDCNSTLRAKKLRYGLTFLQKQKNINKSQEKGTCLTIRKQLSCKCCIFNSLSQQEYPLTMPCQLWFQKGQMYEEVHSLDKIQALWTPMLHPFSKADHRFLNWFIRDGRMDDSKIYCLWPWLSLAWRVKKGLPTASSGYFDYRSKTVL